MGWRQNQYLLFEKSIGKINKLNNNKVKLRKFSKGNTKNGYSYQHNITLERLNSLYKNNKVRIISPEEVMEILLANFEGCMPINDINNM